MQIFQPDSLRWYQFESFSRKELKHAVFTRRGGVSPSPWEQLNMGGTVGDAPENVVENKRRAFHAIGRPTESIFDVWQVHSAEVIRADGPRPLQAPHQHADGIITNLPEVTLLMRFADCVPVLLYDPMKNAVGLVHAGWQGTVKKVVVRAVEAMHLEYGTDPRNLIAGVGPSICARHYQVGMDVSSRVRQAFGVDASSLLSGDEGTHQLDLWQANRLLLEQAGVSHIEVAGICTACNIEDWFSHRGEHGKTGRFGVLLALVG